MHPHWRCSTDCMTYGLTFHGPDGPAERAANTHFTAAHLLLSRYLHHVTVSRASLDMQPQVQLSVQQIRSRPLFLLLEALAAEHGPIFTLAVGPKRLLVLSDRWGLSGARSPCSAPARAVGQVGRSWKLLGPGAGRAFCAVGPCYHLA